MKKKFISIILVLVMIFAITACNNSEKTEEGSKGDAGSGDKRDILVGMSTYLTGRSANLGQAQQNGAEIAIKQINSTCLN